MISNIAPFKVAENLYFVGTDTSPSYLLVSNEGLILIDAGNAQTVDEIIESINKLGFDINNLKYILLSHGHISRTGGTEKLVALTGAKTFLNSSDLCYVFGFTPDYDINDGDIIRLGNVEIECIHTPGHTDGTVSFFFMLQENGCQYRTAVLGGMGVEQLTKSYLDEHGLSYFKRGQFFNSIDRLSNEKVDILVNNCLSYKCNCENWQAFLKNCKESLEQIILEESRTSFVNFAHRGASEYAPENTFVSFNLSVFMRANGIETDIRKTKDGVLVLFHDDTLGRMTGQPGSIADYTYDELLNFDVVKDGLSDKIVRFEDFLRLFHFRNIHFAIELKVKGIEQEVADLIAKYNMEKKTTITSFDFENLRRMREAAPKLKTGYLKSTIDDIVLERCKAAGIDEICPKASDVNPESVSYWHHKGFRVRAWGVKETEDMRRVYDSNADGMTVNFPDKLRAYISEQE